MISNIKRYKQQINFLKSVLDKKASKKSTWARGRYLSKYMRFELSDTFYGLAISSFVVVYFKDKVIYEEGSDGNIYIGYDLSKAELTHFDEDEIIRKLGYGFVDSKFKDSLDIDFGLFNSNNDKTVVTDSKTYKQIMDNLDDLYKTTEIDIKLKDGQFPKLKNRKLLPLYIIQCDKGKVDYCMYSNAETYRKDRRAIGFDSAKFESIVSDAECSDEWVEVKVKGKYIKSY